MRSLKRVETVAPAPAEGVFLRDNLGRFAEGTHYDNRVRMLLMEPSEAAPWLRPHLKRAQHRYESAKRSGLFKHAASRLDGILRAACIADMTHDALAERALAEPNVKAFRELMAEAATYAKQGAAHWSKLIALVGVKRVKGDGGDDPLAALARKVEREQRGDTDDEPGDHDADDE